MTQKLNIKDIVMKFLGYVILAGIVFGLFVVVVAPFKIFKKLEAEKWPSRKGVITLSYASYIRGFGSTGSPHWRSEICGTYSDNGERFCVRHVRLGGFRWGEGKASAFETVAKYPVGREVDIYCSPEDPKETLLEARSPWKEMFVLMGLGIGFLLLPVLLWVFRKKIEPERYGSE